MAVHGRRWAARADEVSARLVPRSGERLADPRWSVRVVGETLRLAPGEFRSSPLAAGRYEITVTPERGNAWRTALAMETSGASCVRDSQRDDVIHLPLASPAVRRQLLSAMSPPLPAPPTHSRIATASRANSARSTGATPHSMSPEQARGAQLGER